MSLFVGFTVDLYEISDTDKTIYLQLDLMHFGYATFRTCQLPAVLTLQYLIKSKELCRKFHCDIFQITITNCITIV